MRYLTPKGHGLVDIILGIVLIFAPNIFGYSGTGAVANISRVLGVLIIINELVTDNGVGPIRLIPMATHLWTDIAAAAVLLVSPWITGQSNNDAHFWVPQAVLAGLLVVVVALTSTELVPVRRR